MVLSKYKIINELNINNANESVVFDESFNILEISKNKKRIWGSGNYSNIIFKCSKCNKIYDTIGALRFYHKKCSKDKQNRKLYKGE